MFFIFFFLRFSLCFRLIFGFINFAWHLLKELKLKKNFRFDNLVFMLASSMVLCAFFFKCKNFLFSFENGKLVEFVCTAQVNIRWKVLGW